MKIWEKYRKWIAVLCTVIAAALCIYFLMPLKTADDSGVKETAEASASPTAAATATAAPTATASAMTASEKVSSELCTLINAYLNDNEIDTTSIGIYVHDFTTGGVYTLNEEEYFLAASTYKLPLGVYYYEMINSGQLSSDSVIDYVVMTEEEITPSPEPEASASADASVSADASSSASTSSSAAAAADPSTEPSASAAANADAEPVTTEVPVVKSSTAGDLLYLMIHNSDNEAGEALYQNLGGWGAFKKLVAKYSSTIDTDDEISNYYSYDNTMSPQYMNDLLAYIYQNKNQFAALIKDMTNSMPNSYLNQNIGTKMAQKYGNYGGAYNSVGFSISGHPYSIAVYTYGFAYGPQIIGDINEICYNYFNQ